MYFLIDILMMLKRWRLDSSEKEETVKLNKSGVRR
jgi:hypothetical protein